MAGEDDPIEDLRAVGMNAAAALSRAAEVLIRAAQETKARRLHAVETDTAQELAREEAQTRAAEQFYARVDVDQLREARPADVAATWQGVHQWRDLDPDRFTDHADRINHDVAEVYGLDGQAAFETYDDITVQETAAMIQDVAAAGPQRDVQTSPARLERLERLEGVDGTGMAVAGEYNTPEARESRRETLASSEVPPAAREARMTGDYLHAQAPRPRRGAPAIAGPGSKMPAVKRARTPDRGRG